MDSSSSPPTEGETTTAPTLEGSPRSSRSHDITAKISRLSARLSGLRGTSPVNQTRKLHGITQHLAGLSQQMEDQTKTAKERLAILTVRAQESHQRLSESTQHLEDVHRKSAKKLGKLDAHCEKHFMAVQEARNTQQTKRHQELVSQFQSLHDLQTGPEIPEACREFQETLSGIQEDLHKGVAKQIDEEHTQKIQMFSDLKDLRAHLSCERKDRETVEEDFLRCLEDMAEQMNALVMKERSERRVTEDMFLKLLEESCQRLQQMQEI